jgi:CSLREA domain-containing protein
MTVNTTNDETTSADSACSLREAIVSVTSNTTGGDCSRASGDNDVTLPAGHYILSPALGELLFAASGATAVITGADPSNPSATNIDAAGTPLIPRRVIEVATGGKATLKNVEISGGLSAAGVDGVGETASGGHQGTFGADGGGILNNSGGALTLDHTLVTDNFTGGGGRGANSSGDGKAGGSGAPGGSGGAIANSGSMNITASTITGNGTGNGGGGGDAGPGVNCPGHFPDGAPGGRGAYSGSGGGIYNLGNASITTSTVSQNFTGVGGVGGHGGHGAGHTTCPGFPDIDFSAGDGGGGGSGGNGSYGTSVFCSSCPFDLQNKAGGGGITSFGTLTMSASTISANNTGAGGMGGASGDPGQNQITFADAQPGGNGGSAGIGGALLVNTSNQTTTLTNVTIAGNSSGNGGAGGAGYNGDTGLGGGRGGYGGDGGAIWSTGANDSGNTILLKHATIAQNGVGAGGAGGAGGTSTPVPGIRGKGAGVAVGGRANPAAGAYGVGFLNTLVANNGNPAFDVNCVQAYDPSQYVDLKDLGNNVSYADATCPGINSNPLLGALANNGGPTLTMLPASGSSAINLVPPASCTVNVDQRGLSRPGPSKTNCDAGAVETGINNPTQLSVTKAGFGAGTVTSSPGGISCGSTCSALYEQGTMVTLTATPTAGSSFTGWSDAGCPGTGTCQVTLSSAKSVTASFADIAPPQTTITGGPAEGSTTNDSTPTFTFSSSEGGSTFECRVDSEPFAACSSPGPGLTGSHTTAALTDGSHTFEVQATDAASNLDVTPDSRTFTVDTTPPPGGGGGGGSTTPPPPGPTGKRAAALKKCKKKKGKARANCIKKAKKLPV